MKIKIEQAETIEIISGEGTGPGTAEEFEGKKTLRAIRMRLTKERCDGDRWAHALVYLPGESEPYKIV